jgi:hypothetical protein
MYQTPMMKKVYLKSISREIRSSLFQGSKLSRMEATLIGYLSKSQKINFKNREKAHTL